MFFHLGMKILELVLGLRPLLSDQSWFLRVSFCIIQLLWLLQCSSFYSKVGVGHLTERQRDGERQRERGRTANDSHGFWSNCLAKS